MRNPARFPARTSAAWVLAACILAGCAGTSVPTRYYQMIPTVEMDAPASSPTRLLGISPVGFPDYLDRPQIVTRATETRMTMAEFDQWSEQLELMFNEVLIENLRRRLGGEHVVAVPNNRGLEPSIELDLNVLRFEADAAGRITLDARWRMFDRNGRLLLTGHSLLSEEATPGDYGAIVDGMSQVVADLSGEIVAKLAEAVAEAGPGNERRRSS
ncbi:MAG TPA: PqiC family protein [Geminicoccus sp.]|uniref:PqiC family protein n=1 Tax=Geminicoccus sp. TaxID=2024832 RepID=UPI002BC036C1|nr:PqiC family protein [Geminicoccus sp.]HWL72187.1 PqiC family protein [Geminicoccus sp.]